MGRIAFAILLTWTGSESGAQDTGLCRSLWAATDDVGEYLAETPCFEYDVRDGTLLSLEGQHRVFYPPGWLTNEGRHDLIRTVVAAVARSVDSLNDLAGRNGFGRITHTNTILGVEDYIEGWSSAAVVVPLRDLTFGETCPVLVDATAARRTLPSRLQQVIAHEVFHCLEHSNGFFPSADDDWWAEGGAEYFSNVVYPRANNEYSVSDDYEPSIRPVDHLGVDRASTNRPYATVTFFQHLGNLAGPDWVLRRMFGLPRSATPDAYHDVVVAWPQFAESFQSFAERFGDREIYDSPVQLTAGALTAEVLPVRDLPRSPETAISADDGTQTVTLQIAPLVFSERPLVFAHGKEFDIEVSTNDMPGRFRVRRKGGTAEWGDMPTHVRTHCSGEPLQYSLLATSSATVADALRDPYTITLQVSAVDRDDCAFELLAVVPYNCHVETDGQRLDECLAGSWRMTDEWLVQSLFGTPPPPYSDDSHLVSTGSIQLAFDGSGTFAKRFDAVIDFTKYDGTTLHNTVSHTMTEYHGTVGGCVVSQQWPIGPSYLVLMSDLDDGVSKHTHGFRDRFGHGVDRTDEGTPWNHWPRLGAGKTRYSCDGDTLTIGSRVYRRIR